MNYLVIGDVHACYYTCKELLDQHWDKRNESLIFLGDLVNKGKNSLMLLQFLFELKQEFKNQIIILKGNNEVLFIEKYHHKLNPNTIAKFQKYQLDPSEILVWMHKLPHLCQNEFFFASHAGISKNTNFPVNESDESLLYNRKSLKKIGKTQFLGHIVVEKPKYDQEANAWYLDTGAGYGQFLSALKITEKAEVLEIISLPVHEEDKV